MQIGGRVLVVAPHYDDEVLGCGGLLARKGADAAVVFVAGRSYSHEYGGIFTKDARGYAESVRELLGYGALFPSAFPDELVGGHFVDVLRHIEAAVLAFKPNVVLLPDHGDLHQDHRAVHRAGMIASRGLTVMTYFVPGGSSQSSRQVDEFKATAYMELTEEEVGLKAQSIALYRDEARERPHLRSEWGVRLSSQWFGAQAGMDLAEPYGAVRIIFACDNGG